MNGRLKIELLHYWHCGGSHGGGAVVDARVHRDGDGLPVVPGRHLKGLLRAACECAEQWQWEQCQSLAARLFGDRTEGKVEHPQPGCLRVADACLPQAESDWLGGTVEGRRQLQGLFRNLHATAIDSATGSAREHSLRGIEVVVPLTLRAAVEPIPGAQPPDDWEDRLCQVLPLITAIGAHRSRGLGRARVEWEKA